MRLSTLFTLCCLLFGCASAPQPKPKAAPSHVTFRFPLAIADSDTFCIEQTSLHAAFAQWSCMSVGELRQLFGELRRVNP